MHRCRATLLALRVFTNSDVNVHAARFKADEVEQYLRLSSKHGLPEHLVWMPWRLLPVTLRAEAGCAQRLPDARRASADRDPDDAHLLALARELAVPLLQGSGRPETDRVWPSHGSEDLLAILTRVIRS